MHVCCVMKWKQAMLLFGGTVSGSLHLKGLCGWYKECRL